MPESIVAVVVTFNRKALLAQCLAALLHQTRPLDKLYVIDQASTDGTGEFLLQKGLLPHPAIEYWRAPVNTGGAGGFHDGMRRASQDGHSWIWIMDDDAIPDPDACERMIPLTAYPEVVAIANRKLKKDRTTDTQHVVLLDKSTPARPYCCLKFSSFVGLMVRRQATDRAGFPKAELFFQLDDNEYCTRLRRYGDIAYASDSNLVHKDAGQLALRQRCCGILFFRLPAEEYWRNYFSFRNELWRITHSADPLDRWAKLKYLAVLSKEVSAVCLLDRKQRLIRLKLLCRAVADGLRGRFDNQFAFAIRSRMLAGGPGATGSAMANPTCPAADKPSVGSSVAP